jgi:uncharacterized protein (DUF305 family)
VPARRTAAALAIAAFLTLAGCGTDRSAAPAAGPAAGSAPASAVFNAADVSFLQQLLPHHRQGVEIARIGAAKATLPDLKIMTGAIVATQQDEQSRMTGWLTAWQQPVAAASPGPATSAKKITALGTAPAAELDHDLLTLLIAHQQAAIKLAAAEQKAGSNPEALAFAQQIELSRAAQITQMKTWLAAS